MELVVLVGLPGAGKTTYYRARFAATHVHVSKDLMPNATNREAKQRQRIEEALAAGRSVVVDNTNPSRAIRAPLVELARKHGARTVAVYFDVTVGTAIVRNERREGKAKVPKVAIFTTRKQLEAPAIDEGFDEVVVVKAE